MQTHACACPAPESYATFWEPVPAPRTATAAPPGPQDAYQQFVDVTEDSPALRQDPS